MTAIVKLVGLQAKRSLRDPAAAVFMIAFAPLFVLMMAAIFGNEPQAEFGNRGFIDANLVSFAGIVVAIASFLLVPTDIVTQRETGVLRRFRATPLRPLAYIAADVLVRFAFSMLSITAMLATGIAFGARPQGSIAYVLLAAALGVLAFLAVGYALATLLPTQGVAQGVGNALTYPLLVLSGATVPLAVLPDRVRQVGQFSPLTQLVDLLQGMWAGETWSQNRLPFMALLGLLGLATAVAAKRFRWE